MGLGGRAIGPPLLLPDFFLCFLFFGVFFCNKMYVFVQKTNRMVIKTWTKFSPDLVEINAFSVISEALNLKIMRGASRKPRAFGALLHATGRPHALSRINALIKRLFCFIDVSRQHLVMLKDRRVNESWRRGFSPIPCWLQIAFASSRASIFSSACVEVGTVGVEGEMDGVKMAGYWPSTFLRFYRLRQSWGQ